MAELCCLTVPCLLVKLTHVFRSLVIHVSYLLYLHAKAPRYLARAICFAIVLHFSVFK